MKLSIFGGTGRTGQELVTQALARGYEIQMLARTPGKMTIQDDKLTVIEGDIQDMDAVNRTITGTDAVVSVLGPTSNTPDHQVTMGTRNILTAMKANGVNRLIVSAGAGVGDPNDAPNFINKAINGLLKLSSKHVLEDMLGAVDLVRQSDVDWTIVRVPMLTDDPATGDVTVAYVGKGMGMRIGRADMAAFMLDQVDDKSYSHKAPAISNK